jgi:hypothetical protein
MIRWTRWSPAWLRGHRQGRSRRPALPPRPLPPTEEGAASEPERPWGCGWFDSSIDLRQGLAVIEHREIHYDLALELMLAPGRSRP